MTNEFRVSGTVVEQVTGRPLPGLIVKAYDKDHLYDDLLGSDRTDESGHFEMRYSESDFQELFETHPDIYLEVLDSSGQNTIHTTKQSIRWDAGVDEQFTIEIPRDEQDVSDTKRDKDDKDDADKGVRPFLISMDGERAAEAEVEVSFTENPLPRATLGDIGLAAAIKGERLSAQSILILPLDQSALTGIDETTVRVFRVDEESGTLKPVWNSGINTTLGFAWAKVRRPGTYVPIGLPRDRLLQELLRQTARERQLADVDSREEAEKFTRDALSLFHEESPEIIQTIRTELARAEAQTAAGGLPLKHLRLGHGGHILPLPLPRDADFKEFAERIRGLEVTFGGLPEEQLFYPPDAARLSESPWPVLQDRRITDVIGTASILDHLIEINPRFVELIRCLISKNWWMYQHDERHSGVASGCSDIRSTNAGTLIEQSQVPVEGPINTKPSIVNGYVYIGSSKYGGSDKSVLYKIELATGTVVGKFEVTGTAFYSISGIGGSPAIKGGKVYFSTVYGQIYCLDSSTMTTALSPPPPLWVTNLKAADMSKNQPVNNASGDSWSGPLVVNGNVYVGSGEGEGDFGSSNPNTYGFVWCLDANTGVVKWVFCTSKFTNGAENSPNVIPNEAAASWAAAHGFTVVADPPQTGNAPWSSAAYDSVTRRIFIGTGNSQYDVAPGPGDGTAQPDYHYGSGLLALDADTGAFAGFFQPAVDDSYWTLDSDIDVPGSATVFTHGGHRVVGFGSKNGSYFLLDAHDLSIIARRQLLPRSGGNGTPTDRGTAIGTVVPTGGAGENKWGVMGTAAMHSGLGTLFVGLGGYAGIGDSTKTPFMRAVDWDTLLDKWTTTVTGGVARYTVPVPPMYSSSEAGLSSPAVVNDVVFIATSKCALYALDAATGLCLWSAPGLPAGGWPNYALGPAIYGNYVVAGAGKKVYIYKLPTAIVHIPWDRYVAVERFPWPPEPDPRLTELVFEIREMLRR
jgi:outer membrane protein assembly factor BamB